MRLLIASHNKKKIEEMRRILEPMGVETLSPEDVGVESDAKETGATFQENARIKAMELFHKTDIPTIADDSGLCVDSLGGRPGVQSARYGGEELPYDDKIRMLLGELEGVPMIGRTARFVCAICCVLSGNETIETEGTCEGTIGFQPIGSGGFGYDPVFMVEGKSFGTLSPEEKDEVSHRSAALRLFQEKMKEYLSSKESV